MAPLAYGTWSRRHRGLACGRSSTEHPSPLARASGWSTPEAHRRCAIHGFRRRATVEPHRPPRPIRSRKRMDIRSDEPELRSLMLAGLDGDAASHKALLKRLSAYLRAYFKGQLLRIGRGSADAEDLVQETLIALHTRRHTYDRSQLLTPWVYAIARYRLVDYLRRTKASVKDAPVEEATQLFADDDATVVDSRLDLHKLMARLAPKTRRAIEMVKLDGLSVREAAARSGMSESAVKVSVHRGLKALSLLVGTGAAHEN